MQAPAVRWQGEDLSEELQGLQTLRLGEVAMQLCTGGQTTEAEEQVHAVRALLGSEEDDGGQPGKGP